MATHSVARSKHATLSGTTADVVTVTGVVPVLQVVNRHATNPLYFKYASVDPGAFAAAADDSIVVPAASSVAMRLGAASLVVRVVGNGNDYSVQALPVPR